MPEGQHPFETGAEIYLRAFNGLYLSRINRGDRDPIEAAKGAVDPFCRFIVTVLDNNKIALQADNRKYLSLIRRDGADLIEAAKSAVDAFCELEPSLSGDPNMPVPIIVLKASNGTYVGRATPDGQDACPIVAAAKFDGFHVWVTAIS